MMAATLQRCVATQQQSGRAAAVRYKSRTRAQIYDVVASLSSYRAAHLHTLARHSTLSLAMLYSCREWFIAGMFIFCLLSMHTHTHTHSLGTAHSLWAGEREREQLFLCQTYACVVVDGSQKGKQLNWANGTGVSEPANQSPPIFRVGKRHKTAGNSKTAKIEANILHFPASQHYFVQMLLRFAAKTLPALSSTGLMRNLLEEHAENWFRARPNLWLHVAFIEKLILRHWANCFVYGRLLLQRRRNLRALEFSLEWVFLSASSQWFECFCVGIFAASVLPRALLMRFMLDLNLKIALLIIKE